jgi:hypothetical protein
MVPMILSTWRSHFDEQTKPFPKYYSFYSDKSKDHVDNMGFMEHQNQHLHGVVNIMKRDIASAQDNIDSDN